MTEPSRIEETLDGFTVGGRNLFSYSERTEAEIAEAGSVAAWMNRVFAGHYAKPERFKPDIIHGTVVDASDLYHQGCGGTPVQRGSEAVCSRCGEIWEDSVEADQFSIEDRKEQKWN